MELPLTRCNETLKPEEAQPCNRRLCVFKWTTDEWTQCSATCGKGSVKSRDLNQGPKTHTVIQLSVVSGACSFVFINHMLYSSLMGNGHI